MRSLHIDCDIWSGYVRVVWDCTADEAAEELERSGEEEEACSQMRESTHDYGATVTNGHRALIWIPTPLQTAEQIGTLSHEALHAACALCTHRGLLLEGGEEAFAYTIDHIMTAVLRESLSDEREFTCEEGSGPPTWLEE